MTVSGLDGMKVSSALDYASGTATRNGTTLDMAGFEGVLMIVKFATIAASATTSIYASEGAASNLSDAAQIDDSKIGVAADDDNQIYVLDIKPNKRYVRVTVAKDSSNAVAESAVYVKYGPTQGPVDSTSAGAVTELKAYYNAEGTTMGTAG